MSRPTAIPARLSDSEVQPTARQLGIVWVFLVINVIGSAFGGRTLLPLSYQQGQLITMGSLFVAFGLALRLNPMVRVRANAYLILLTAMAVVAVVSSYRLEAGLGGLIRCFRLAMFVGTLWLLSHWWRGDLRFARFHVAVFGGLLATVLLGLIVAPGLAYDGQLYGVVWPIHPNQVGQYSAVVAGLVGLMWLGGRIEGRRAALIIAPALVVLILGHSRTATAGLLIGLTVAGLPLARRSVRAGRAIAVVGSSAVLIVLTIPHLLWEWFLRDQNESEFASLSGREQVWNALLAHERTLTEALFGIGLSNKSFGGIAIDSAWLAGYQELGIIGVSVVAAFMLSLLVTAALRPASVSRSCAVFLILYCLVASYTEVGLSDASSYLLHLAVAASLLATPDAGEEKRIDAAGEKPSPPVGGMP